MKHFIFTGYRQSLAMVGSALTVVALVFGTALAGPAAAAPEAPPSPTSQIAGTVAYRDGTATKGVMVRYLGVDCRPAHKVSYDPHHDGSVRVKAGGGFSFDAHSGLCYELTVTGWAGIDQYRVSLGGAKYRDKVFVTAGTTKARLRLNARPVKVTLNGARKRSAIGVYQGGGSYWQRVTGDSNAYKGEITFDAVPGNRYTFYYSADTSQTAYSQTVGGDPRRPSEADDTKVVSLKVRSGKGQLNKSFNLTAPRPGAIFAPKLELVNGTEFVVGAKVKAVGPGKGWRVSYQWFSGGRPVGWGQTYKLRGTDAGRNISCEVTTQKSTYRTVTKRTEAVKVLKLPSTVTLSLGQNSVWRGSKGQVTVRVSIKGVARPDGTVKLHYGGRSITQKLHAYDKSVLIMTLPQLSPGTYSIRADYYDSSYSRPSSATPVSLTVR